MAKRVRVYLSRAKETSRSRGGVRAGTILALFAGIGQEKYDEHLGNAFALWLLDLFLGAMLLAGGAA